MSERLLFFLLMIVLFLSVAGIIICLHYDQLEIVIIIIGSMFIGGDNVDKLFDKCDAE